MSSIIHNEKRVEGDKGAPETISEHTGAAKVQLSNVAMCDRGLQTLVRLRTGIERNHDPANLYSDALVLDALLQRGLSEGLLREKIVSPFHQAVEALKKLHADTWITGESPSRSAIHLGMQTLVSTIPALHMELSLSREGQYEKAVEVAGEGIENRELKQRARAIVSGPLKPSERWVLSALPNHQSAFKMFIESVRGETGIGVSMDTIKKVLRNFGDRMGIDFHYDDLSPFGPLIEISNKSSRRKT